LYNLKTGKHKH